MTTVQKGPHSVTQLRESSRFSLRNRQFLPTLQKQSSFFFEFLRRPLVDSTQTNHQSAHALSVLTHDMYI